MEVGGSAIPVSKLSCMPSAMLYTNKKTKDTFFCIEIPHASDYLADCHQALFFQQDTLV